MRFGEGKGHVGVALIASASGVNPPWVYFPRLGAAWRRTRSMRPLHGFLVQANIHLLVRVILLRKAVAYRSETLHFPLLEVTVMSTELFRTHSGREIAVSAVCDG